MEPLTSETEAPKSQWQIFFKIGFILLLILLLMIPIAMTDALIYERAGLEQEAITKVSQSWGREQVVSGAVLAIPYTEKTVLEGKPTLVEHVRYLLPETSQMQVDVKNEKRTLGIYDVAVFTASCSQKGRFDLGALPKSQNTTYQWNKAALLMGIADQAAILGKTTATWGGSETKTIPGIPYGSVLPGGFHSNVACDAQTNIVEFAQTFSLRGTSSLDFRPTGKVATIDMASDWNHPSFNGRLLPSTRYINQLGFTAHWDANEYNRLLPNYWDDAEHNFGSPASENDFGVNFVQVADHYQKNTRSTKYALLVIALSFVVFFFYEVLLKIRIHPIQYMLVGLSLAIFYVLLLSLTEHVGFNRAYLSSAAAVIALVGIYIHAIIQRSRYTFLMVGLFAFLYGYIFVLLQLEDFALLAGALGLFAILACVMLMSRKVDWYGVKGA
jgi:inner membrane protein